MDEAYGILETVDKAAQVYMLITNKEEKNTITDECLKQIVETFNVDVRREFLY